MKRLRERSRLLAVAVSLALTTLIPTPAGAAAASGQVKLFAGQDNVSAWSDLTAATGASPDGGSVYYSVATGSFSGPCQSSSCPSYLNFLGSRGAGIEVGVDWKDNPPGWDGQAGDEENASQQATEAIAHGRYDSQFNALVSAVKQYSGSTFYLRLDYEVSSAFDCLGGTDCSSYRAAFQHLVTLIRNESGAGQRVQFVYHPVRGEFAQLYPGDAWVDWIGMSVFNNDLCQPFWDNGAVDWDGTENQSARTCSGYYDANVGGNINALPYGYPADFNDLDMLWFAQQHGKPVMIAESGVQRMTGSLNSDGTQDDPDYTQWMNRLATLIDYRGPLPNTVINGQPTDFVGTGYNLAGVVRLVTYIDIDWRYGFDGQLTPTTPFGESTSSGWFVNSLLSRYPQGRNAFCTVLADGGFDTGCTT